MSIDGSLKTGGRLVRSRNVLKRSERIEKLQERNKFDGESSPFGLPKVRVIKASIGKTKKKEKKEEE